MTDRLAASDVLAWGRELYAKSVDHKDAAGFAAAFTEGAWLRFGNNPPIVGRDAIREAIAGFFTAFQTLSHEGVGAWYADGALILEALVTYLRHDGARVTVPAVTIFRVDEAASSAAGALQAGRCQIYVDLTPLFAPTAA